MDDTRLSRKNSYSIWSASLTFILSLCAFVLCAGSGKTGMTLGITAVVVLLAGISTVLAWKRYIDHSTT